MAAPRLILASTSPRRRALLAAAGVEFELGESGVEEERHADEPAAEFALRMAEEKALAVSRRADGALVLGADTVVECGGEILGKPRDHADAHRMLRTLSGRFHVVVTAFALARDGRVAREPRHHQPRPFPRAWRRRNRRLHPHRRTDGQGGRVWYSGRGRGPGGGGRGRARQRDGPAGRRGARGTAAPRDRVARSGER